MSKRAERFAFARCLFWCVNMPAAVYLYLEHRALWLQISVLYLVVVSIYANAESGYASYAAKRAERRGIENPPPE